MDKITSRGHDLIQKNNFGKDLSQGRKKIEEILKGKACVGGDISEGVS